MALPEGVLTLQGRIDTFAVAHQLTKRRVSSLKKRGPATVSWPHKSPLPVELARAGFFYKPNNASDDNCMCFCCHRMLDGWEDGDDPIQEHIKHSPDCGWAINAIINKRTSNGEFVNEDPMSEKLAEARAATYADSWPYEQKKGWKCKIAKMVAAGWCYDPSPEYDDGVTCMYCNLSLDGWEPKDDPFKEHQKRCPECEFFVLLDEWAAARKQAKKRGGRASKTSRLSAQSNLTVASDAPTISSLDDLPVGEDDSILTTTNNATTASTTGKGRKKAVAKGKNKDARGRKQTSAMDSASAESQPSETNQGALEEAQSMVEPPKKRATRTASRTISSQLEDMIIPSQLQKSTRSKAAKAKEKRRISDDESQLHVELQAAVESSLLEEAGEAETYGIKRGTKRTSDGLAKMMDSSVIMLDEEPEFFQAQQDKPKRGRNTKKQMAAESEPTTSDAAEAPPRVASLPEKPVSKTRKVRKVENPAEPEPETEAEQETETEPEVEYPSLNVVDLNIVDVAQSLVAPTNPFVQDADAIAQDFTASLEAPVNPYRLEQHTPERSEDASPAPPTPTPARQSSARLRRTLTPAKAIGIAKDPTPTPSPQSSDAENHPPSSKPVARPLPPLPQSAQRIPLADTTPDHLNMSPSKRNVLNNITSTHHWSPGDLSDIFLKSPAKVDTQSNAIASADGDDWGNQAGLNALVDLQHLDAKEVREVVARLRNEMSDVERAMSVEEWVRWNAGRGEERLRRECEGLVGKFEREGGRALRSLEGIRCID